MKLTTCTAPLACKTQRMGPHKDFWDSMLLHMRNANLALTVCFTAAQAGSILSLLTVNRVDQADGTVSAGSSILTAHYMLGACEIYLWSVSHTRILFPPPSLPPPTSPPPDPLLPPTPSTLPLPLPVVVNMIINAGISGYFMKVCVDALRKSAIATAASTVGGGKPNAVMEVADRTEKFKNFIVSQ